MKFYVMCHGLFREIPASERREHATFYEFASEDDIAIIMNNVEFISGPSANDTKFVDVKFDEMQSIKVCGSVVFSGRPVGAEKIIGNNWGQRGDYYLRTEIITTEIASNKLYCYSWIANYSEEDAVCISFEIRGKIEK